MAAIREHAGNKPCPFRERGLFFYAGLHALLVLRPPRYPTFVAFFGRGTTFRREPAPAVTTCSRAEVGSVYDVMLNKATGQVAYAIMSFGGFLGMGESYLPWRALTYDTRQDGYVVDIDRQRLEGAPNYSASDAPNWSDRAYGQSVDRYYGY